MNSISYKRGYKYQLYCDYSVEVAILPEKEIKTKYLCLSVKGRLCINNGYCWDGPSGPTFDTGNFMRGSAVHDALYQLMRNNHISSEWRDYADRLLQKMCKEDGMSSLRAWWVYTGLKYFGGAAADPANKKPILKAP